MSKAQGVNRGFGRFLKESNRRLEAVEKGGPENVHQWRRAQAELQFRTRLDSWLKSHKDVYPWSPLDAGTRRLSASPTISSESLGEVAFPFLERDRAAASLQTWAQTWAGEYVVEQLSSHEQCLTERGIHGPEAAEDFRRFMNKLLAETYPDKWLYGLRKLGIPPESYAALWDALKQHAAEVAHDFELAAYQQAAQEIEAGSPAGGPLQQQVPSRSEIPGEPHAAAKTTNGAGPSATQKRRASDYDRFTSELIAILQETQRYTDVPTLKAKFPGYEVWSILTEPEQESLLVATSSRRSWPQTS